MKKKLPKKVPIAKGSVPHHALPPPKRATVPLKVYQPPPTPIAEPDLAKARALLKSL